MITVSNLGSGCWICGTTPCICAGGKQEFVSVPLSMVVSPEVLATIYDIAEDSIRLDAMITHGWSVSGPVSTFEGQAIWQVWARDEEVARSTEGPRQAIDAALLKEIL